MSWKRWMAAGALWGLLLLSLLPAAPARAEELKPLYGFTPEEPYPQRTVDRPFTMGARMSLLDISFNYQTWSKEFNDSGSFQEVPFKQTNVTGTLTAAYGYTYFLEIRFILPFVMKTIKDNDGPNEGETYTGNGLGDLEFEITYQLQNTGRLFIAGTLGAKFPGSENDNPEGEALATGSSTFDFFFRVPFKKAYRNWGLGGIVEYRFFGQDKASDRRFGNRLDMEAFVVVQFIDEVALQGWMRFLSQGESQFNLEDNPDNSSLYSAGPELFVTPNDWLDLRLRLGLPIRGVNFPKYDFDATLSVAARF